MKQPRIGDFDPSAKQRELKSPLEDFPVIEQPNQVRQTDSAGVARQPVRPVLHVRDAPIAAPGRRKIKPRHPFDIYEDQDEELRKLAVEDRMRGGTGSMSKMVREAIDDYLAKVRPPQGE